MLSTSYKDTLESIQEVHNVNFYNHLLLLLIKVGLPLQKGNKTVLLKCLETRMVLCSEKRARNRSRKAHQ